MKERGTKAITQTLQSNVKSGLNREGNNQTNEADKAQVKYKFRNTGRSYTRERTENTRKLQHWGCKDNLTKNVNRQSSGGQAGEGSGGAFK